MTGNKEETLLTVTVRDVNCALQSHRTDCSRVSSKLRDCYD